MRASPITISSTDYGRLLALVNSARLDRRIPMDSLLALEQELGRATIVEPDEVPGDIVTMNSTVWFRDVDSDEVESYTLVYPSQADVIQNRISVLAPLGTALLGDRVGTVVQWQVPSGKRKFEILDVLRCEPQRSDGAAAVLV
jgi:regulator of nucleoside diphosphate kinase